MKKLIAAALLLFSSVGAFGQSESFNNPLLKKQWMCENETKIVVYVLVQKHSGVTKEKMLADMPFPEYWSADRREFLNTIIDQIYASTKTPQAYSREYMDLCLKRVAS